MMNHVNNRVEKHICTGCSVCFTVCPVNAISMEKTPETFSYPIVDEGICINCGLCVKSCHAISPKIKKKYKQEYYEVSANDDIRKLSASGGMTTIVSKYVLDNGGYVVGAAFNSMWEVEHIIINKESDLNKIRGSKYIESKINKEVFKEIKKILLDGKLLLFTGCPCQVSALYSFLGKEYDNLITIDLLCHGIVTNDIWQKYLNENFDKQNIKHISFRDKEKIGWDIGLYIKFKDGKEFVEKKNNIYLSSYLSNFIFKQECIYCQYRKRERVGDITIGDFWGIKNHDGKGVSLITINSNKGKDVFNKVKDTARYKQYETANNAGFYPPAPIQSNREYFFNNLDKYSFKDLIKNSNDITKNIFIDNTIFVNNYGAVLTYYALYQILKKLGYNPIMPFLGDYAKEYKNLDVNSDIFSVKFIKKYLTLPNSIYNKDALKRISKLCNIFLVGSDQLWSRWVCKDRIYFHLLNFVYNDINKKISYSTSFGGRDVFEGILRDDKEFTLLFKHYLKQFSHISVREDVGVNIAKNTFDMQAKHVLDPVFLLEQKDYNILLDNYKKEINEKDFIFVYFRYLEEFNAADKDSINKLIKIAKEKNKKIILSTCDRLSSDKLEELKNKYPDVYFKSFIDIEEWLFYIKNSDFVVSNSFHASCFSIIFNKQFILLYENTWDARMTSLLKMFKLNDRMIDSKNRDKIPKILFTKIDYNIINKDINIMKEDSINWLINAIKDNNKNNDYKVDLFNYLIEENKVVNNKIDNLNNQLKNYSLIIDNLNKVLNNVNTEESKQITDSLNNMLKNYNTNNINILNNKVSYMEKQMENIVNTIAWWIPIKKLRDNFRNKMLNRPDQTRPDQTRPDQTRPDHEIICIDYIYIYHNSKYKKIQQPMPRYKIAA